MQIGISPGVMPCLPMAAGRYYFVPNSTSTTTNAGQSNNSLWATACFIPQRVAVTKMGAEVTAIGEAGSKVRLGIYDNDPSTMRPGSLVLDAGQIAGDSATVQELTVTGTSLAPGWYWFCWVVQSAPSTLPTLRCCAQGSIMPPIDIGTTIPASNATAVVQRMTGVSGALPAAFTVFSSGGQFAPRIFIKT